MHRLYLPLATAILLVAAILRLWLLHLYPPGPHYDEGAYLLITRSIAFGGARFFPIVEAYQGREVLYMYLNAPLLYLFGDSIYTLRLSSAFFNLITAAAAIRVAREMFRGERGIVVALAVGVVAAISFPQIFIARQAFRAVTLPMMQALALVFLWHGLNARRGYGWLALGGFFAGGAVYTYMASRLFPFWLALAALALLWLDRAHWRRRLAQGVVFFGVLAITAAPMVVYALQRPDIFWGRFGEVTETGEPVTLAQSILLHLRMFFIEGDPLLRYNVPGRSYFTPLEGALLLVGIVVAAAHLFSRRARPLERTAYALVLLSPLMVIPSIVSLAGLPPNHLRSLGMIPLIFVLVGVGFEAVFRWSVEQVHGVNTRRVLTIVTALALGIGGLFAAQTYFAWAARGDLFYQTDADLSLAARWLASQTDANTRVYLAARDRSHPTVMIEQTPPITWLGTTTLFRPPSGNEGLYVFPRSAPPPDDWRAWLEPGRIADLPLGPDGRTAFEAFRLPGDTPMPASDPLPQTAVRNPYLTLVGVQAPTLAGGASGEVVTEWQIDSVPADSDLTPLVQLEDANGTLLSRADIYMTDTDHWERGAVFFARLPVSVPDGTPPGRYLVRVAWVARARDTYTPYEDAAGRQEGIWATVGAVEVTRPAAFPAPDAVPMDVRLNQDTSLGIRLVGYNGGQATVRPGESLALALTWQALDDAPPAATYRALLRGAGGDTLLWSGTPLGTRYPPGRWTRNELLVEHVYWDIHREQVGGDYRVVLAWQGGEVELGNVRVEGIPRVFEPPPVATPVDALFGRIIRLVGYTLTLDDGMQLDLVWQSAAPTTQDYTVFVHILDANGMIVAQRDVMPVDNTYPTRLWLPGEYVIDQHLFTSQFSLGYHLEVGLYLAETGVRLEVTDETGQRRSDHVEIEPS